MKRVETADGAVGVALSWDGARLPRRELPASAREFLAGAPGVSQRDLTARAKQRRLKEIRICWVPRLRGGKGTLAPPFQTADDKRVLYRVAKIVPIGEMLGVIYRIS
jgi:hypothetical protein